jgi:hypothetical protein
MGTSKRSDVMNDIATILHILRNPYGFDEERVREIRLDAANLIEAYNKRHPVGQEPTAYCYTIDAYMDHAKGEGVVLKMEKMNHLPKMANIKFTPLYRREDVSEIVAL